MAKDEPKETKQVKWNPLLLAGIIFLVLGLISAFTCDGLKTGYTILKVFTGIFAFCGLLGGVVCLIFAILIIGACYVDEKKEEGRL